VALALLSTIFVTIIKLLFNIFCIFIFTPSPTPTPHPIYLNPKPSSSLLITISPEQLRLERLALSIEKQSLAEAAVERCNNVETIIFVTYSIYS
jgi:hypothetical protein